jgi:hypothetical protein
MCMIETVAHERFYKDAAHEPLHPTVQKDWLLLALPTVVVPPPPAPTPGF